jgi:hypothetical protein
MRLSCVLTACGTCLALIGACDRQQVVGGAGAATTTTRAALFDPLDNPAKLPLAMLIRAIDSPDDAPTWNIVRACEELCRRGPAARAAIPALQKLSWYPDAPLYHYHARAALRAIDPRALDTVAFDMLALDDQERIYPVEGLERERKGIVVPSARELAAAAAVTPGAQAQQWRRPPLEIGSIRTTEFFLPSHEIVTRKYFQGELERFIASHRTRIGEIAEVLRTSREGSARMDAVVALRLLAAVEPEAAIELKGGLADSEPQIRLGTLKAIGMVQPTPPGMSAAVAERIGDEEPSVRDAAIALLKRWTAVDDESIPTEAADALAEAVTGKPAVPGVVAAAAEAWRVTPALAGALLGCLGSSDGEVRELAVLALARPDVRAAASDAGLIAALRDADPRVRRAAAYGLRDRGGSGRSEALLAELTEAVDQGNFVVREALAEALGRSVRENVEPLAALKDAAARADDPTAAAYARVTLKRLEAREGVTR